MRVAIEAVMQGGEEGSHNHDDNTDIVEFVESFRDGMGVTLDGVVGGGKAETDESANEEGGKSKYVEIVRPADGEIGDFGGDGRRSSR